jgi:predicted tellurium resistance membrane protein TerC
LFDFSIFATPEAWISLVTLAFLEVILGVDNIVFIVLTTDRLPKQLQHIGRRFGLLAAMCMRILFLSFASYLVHMTSPLFAVNLGPYDHSFAVRDLVLFLGGVYLIYKGMTELRAMMAMAGREESADDGDALRRKTISLPQAIGTIMIMDVVFSIDSVITAVGLADHLIIMIFAVMSAVFVMMAFIDPISKFINEHTGMKILALFFITTIGILLSLDGAGITSGIEVLGMHMEKLMVYFSMVFCVVFELVSIAYNKRVMQVYSRHNEGAQEER